MAKDTLANLDKHAERHGGHDALLRLAQD
jgi:hypothetical protein